MFFTDTLAICILEMYHKQIKSYHQKLYKQISDFGLAKLMPEGQETCVTTATVLGTFGYFDPEYTLVRLFL